jgi:hypothetical protein
MLLPLVFSAEAEEEEDGGLGGDCDWGCGCWGGGLGFAGPIRQSSKRGRICVMWRFEFESSRVRDVIFAGCGCCWSLSKDREVADGRGVAAYAHQIFAASVVCVRRVFGEEGACEDAISEPEGVKILRAPSASQFNRAFCPQSMVRPNFTPEAETAYMAEVTCGEVFCESSLFKFFVFSMMSCCDGRSGNVASSRILGSPVFLRLFFPFTVRWVERVTSASSVDSIR